MLSDDGRRAFLVEEKGAGSWMNVMDLRDPKAPDLAAPLVPLLAGRDARYTPMGTVGDTLYVFTDLAAPRGRIIALDLGAGAEAPPRTIVAESPNVIQWATVAGDRLALHYLVDVKSRLRLFGLDGRPAGEVPLPGIGALGWPVNGRHSAPEVLFSFTSFLSPETVYYYDLRSGMSTPFRPPRVPFDPRPYETRQDFYTAKDGTQIPMLLPALGPNNVATQFFVGLKNDLVPAQVGGLNVTFAYQEPWDAYIVMFKVAFFLALLTSSPVISIQVGRFIGPALRPSEKRLIARVMIPVLLLFLAGVLLCFIVVLPFTFRLLYGAQIVGGATLLILYADSFINFVLLFALGFGLAFQLPVLMYGLGALGIVGADFWKKYWRFAVIGIFAFGALITPDGSGVTMMLVSLPMLALYVGGYAATRRMERRRNRAKSS